MQFDYQKYRRSSVDPAQIETYQRMTVELEALIKNAGVEAAAILTRYRDPVTVACLEYQIAIKAGIERDEALSMAVSAYTEQQMQGWM